jgi:hypothetical protein
MRYRGAIAALGTLLTVLSVGAGKADDTKPGEPKKPDSGKFILTIQGMKAGTDAFKFDAEGGSEATVAIDIAGQSQKFTVSVKAKGGKMTGFGADAGPTNHFTATVEGGKARVRINDGAADAQEVPAGALPFGNFSPHLLNGVLAAYDDKKAGAQPVTLLQIEGLPNGQIVSLKAKLASKGGKEKKVAGKPLQVTAYSLTLDAGGTDIEILLYANADRRLLAWDVPSQQYTAIREGFEDVLKGAEK